MMRLATLSALCVVLAMLPRPAGAQTREIQKQVKELLAQEKAKAAEALRAAQDAADKKKADKAQEMFEFEMRNKSWSAVFEWLSDKTGRPFVSNVMPKGNFHFVPKEGQKFTIPQIIDIINDGLLAN